MKKKVTELTFTFSKSTIETRKSRKTCSKLTIKTPTTSVNNKNTRTTSQNGIFLDDWRHYGVFIVNFEHIFSSVSIATLSKQLLAVSLIKSKMENTNQVV